MSTFQHRAERIKIARLLRVPVEQLQDLEGLDVEPLRALRVAMADALFIDDSKYFGRLAAVTKLLPAALSASVCERALGALICGRAAGLLAPEDAAAIAKRLSPSFIADIAPELNPRRTAALLQQLPHGLLGDAALELERRGEHVAMAGFVDVLSLEALTAIIRRLSDRTLLEVGVYIESPATLDALDVVLDDNTLVGLVQATLQDPVRLCGLARWR